MIPGILKKMTQIKETIRIRMITQMKMMIRMRVITRMKTTV